MPRLEGYMAVRPASANAYIAAFGMMTPPVIVMAVIADHNRRVACVNHNFRGCRKGTQNHRGNRSAQNKQSHLQAS